ncbi:hypothetical protein [Kordia sp.]|uniref:hypothetical protein n=1 Tax=Kordia sp. TaxID=1965332 RepID=UPI003D2D0FB6
METELPRNPEHVQTFLCAGHYSIEKNEIELSTEIPSIALLDNEENSYILKHEECFDISTERIPCMLSVYAHGHPTHRRKLRFENMRWDKSKLEFNKTFIDFQFSARKILVITVHDEDFEDWHASIYKFFVQNYVTYDDKQDKYNLDINILQEFINGPYVDIKPNEEPRTVGGGVIDPI